MSKAHRTTLSIGDLARATGVGEATLRAWERRYGFPTPRREPSGHRRYDPGDVERVRRVLDERDRGFALGAAIERSTGVGGGVPSLFARLRDARPDLQPVPVRKRELIALSRAIEEESCARAEQPVLVGSFQRERFYRQSERRWRDLARTADTAFVFADFSRVREPRGAPVEVPVQERHPLGREWAIVCDAAEHGACMVAWEPPGQSAHRDRDRRFELLLSVEPSVVREAMGVAAELLDASAPGLAPRLRARQDAPPPPSAAQLRLAGAITARMLQHLA